MTKLSMVGVGHRKTPQLRRPSPLMYHRDGDLLAVVASKADQSTDPASFHNLLAHPETTGQLDFEVRPVCARVANNQERQQRWPQVLAFYPGDEEFRRRAQPGQIPLAIREPR